MNKLAPRPNLGHQPLSKPMRDALAQLVKKREPEEQIVVHHYTDFRVSLQLEYERRSKLLGVTFGRLLIPSA